VADVSSLVELLTLVPVDDGVFEPTHVPSGGPDFIFGGQLLGQSVRAASATVGPDRLPHSVHAHFFTAGRPGDALTYHVESPRDGGSFSARRVHAVQHGTRFFTATVSFNVVRPASGASYQLPAPAAPDPTNSAFPWVSVMAGADQFAAFELREMAPAPPDAAGIRPFSRRLWWRTAGALPDDPALHAAVIAFASDFGVTIAASVTAGLYGTATVLTSLDHALWLHRPVRADAWSLLDLVSVSNAASRGLVRGTMHDASGELTASLAQETLIR
jgi:acyl-CoA thioesterase-2